MFSQRFIATLIIVLAMVPIGFEARTLADRRLLLAVLDIGQGSATLIRTPSGINILIDGGPNGRTLEHLGTLLPFFDQSIDIVILSHPNLDHLVSIPPLIQRGKVGTIVTTGVTSNLGVYNAIFSQGIEKKIEWIDPGIVHSLDLHDGVVLEFLWPDTSIRNRALTEENDTSTVVRVLFHGKPVMLIPGDLEAAGEMALLKTGKDVQAKILVAGHHGSKSSSSDAFLDAVNPAEFAISCGKDNSYGHPHRVILDHVSARKIPIRRTDKEGTIVWRFGGNY